MAISPRTRILSLPYEILDLIIDLLVRSLMEDGEPKEVPSIVIGQMRLVCKDWSIALLQRPSVLRIENDEKSNEILSHWYNPINTKRNREIPKTQTLSIKQLWVGKDSIKRDSSFSSFDNLNKLLLLFSDSLIELDLEFSHCFDFPIETIKIIERLEWLSILRLSVNAERLINLNQPKPPWAGTQGSFRPDNLSKFLTTSQKLRHLDLNHLPAPSLPLILDSTGLPAINQLEFDYFGDQSSDALVKLCIALKKTLRVLSIRGFRQNVLQLRPVFEVLRETIEGLFISDEKLLTDVLDLPFPSLHVFRIHYWSECISNFLDKKMFENLTTIALYSHTIHRRRRKFKVDPFKNMSRLRQLIFTHTRIGDCPPNNYVQGAKLYYIPIVYISHGDIEHIMKLDCKLRDRN
ncbi:hypothetical protein CROQUDRAFT_134794 [Cronartium quercuum f. sp. fusiforme G11]|uniref:F-box domain-containing protein n=1 Tax=Cronartium quercuum f. sp. fusiforme G11 TaxID=708437 RepID=A0A9P6NBT6_9BASI|nr:hypothetical protein CROQUDRAFT_134794 [Cronartium quercuum f. sp. fusiforme G11]